jgi:hypothetical protein
MSTSISHQKAVRKLFPILLAGLSLAGLGTGCGATAKASSHPPTPTSTTASGSADLKGSYVRTVTKADLARTNRFRHEGTGQSLPPTGTYHLTFAGDTFKVTDATGFAIAQTYAATSAGHLSVILYVNPNQGAFCGPDIAENAAYKWSLSHTTLTLRAATDACADRDSILQGQWTRVGPGGKRPEPNTDR